MLRVISESLDSGEEGGTFPFVSFPIPRSLSRHLAARIFSSPRSRRIASLFKAVKPQNRGVGWGWRGSWGWEIEL